MAALAKARKCEKIHTAEELIARVEKKLFQKSQFSDHGIHHYCHLFMRTSTFCCFAKEDTVIFMLLFVKSKSFRTGFFNRCLFFILSSAYYVALKYDAIHMSRKFMLLFYTMFCMCLSDAN